MATIGWRECELVRASACRGLSRAICSAFGRPVARTRVIRVAPRQLVPKLCGAVWFNKVVPSHSLGA
jgi:hypothetical protein